MTIGTVGSEALVEEVGVVRALRAADEAADERVAVAVPAGARWRVGRRDASGEWQYWGRGTWGEVGLSAEYHMVEAMTVAARLRGEE